MFDFSRGGNDTFTQGTASDATFYGDAGGNMSGHAQGGDDTFTGGDVDFVVEEHFDGDAKSMSESAKGGNDTLTGANQNLGPSAGFGPVTNILFGDAEFMSGSAKGGDDTLFAGTTVPDDNETSAVINDM